MAEERNLGAVRAAADSAVSEEEATKEQLQRRMEEARESITQTVSEIKDTVSTQYQTVKESINEALDWREQYRKRPLAFNVGALTVGLFVGYGVAAALSDSRRRDYNVFDVSDEDVEDEDQPYASASYAPRSYAAGGITGRAVATPAPRQYAAFAGAAPASVDREPDEVDVASDEPTKPGIIERIKESNALERFKESRAYDRLQNEVSSIGDRLLDEVSHTAQAVVLPALLGKLKDMIGIDLSAQQREAQRSEVEKKVSTARSEAIEAKNE